MNRSEYGRGGQLAPIKEDYNETVSDGRWVGGRKARDGVMGLRLDATMGHAVQRQVMTSHALFNQCLTWGRSLTVYPV